VIGAESETIKDAVVGEFYEESDHFAHFETFDLCGEVLNDEVRVAGSLVLVEFPSDESYSSFLCVGESSRFTCRRLRFLLPSFKSTSYTTLIASLVLPPFLRAFPSSPSSFGRVAFSFSSSRRSFPTEDLRGESDRTETNRIEFERRAVGRESGEKSWIL